MVIQFASASQHHQRFQFQTFSTENRVKMKLEVIFVATFFMSLSTAANIALFPVPSNNTQVTQTNNSTDNHIKIVGGMPAIKNEYPWLVNMQSEKGLCGGSLIDLDLVLTAAHCVYNVPYSTITVTAGDHHLQILESTEQIVSARAVKWHEKYNEATLANDIALVWLSQNVTVTSAVRPIRLPPSDMQLDPSILAVVAGWGTTSENGQISDILLKIAVPITDLNQCKQLYVGSGAEITDKHFCAGYPGRDTCQGDSGGPILCNGREIVCGIVSFGEGCGRFPGVYAKVSSYISWIDANRDGGMPTTSTPAPNTSPSFVSNMYSTVTFLSLVIFIYT